MRMFFVFASNWAAAGGAEWQETMADILGKLNKEGTELIMAQEVNDTLAEFDLPQGWRRLRSLQRGQVSGTGCQILYHKDTLAML